MGAYSPVPLAGTEIVEQILSDFVEPTLEALRNRGIDYRGVLYAGLMMTPSGPRMLEYNVRFGDPEAQVVLPRLNSDLAQLLAEAAAGQLTSEPEFSDDAMVTVVCASENYPATPRTGDVIVGIDEAEKVPGVQVFCAGVGEGDEGDLTTSGGRVLNVTGRGPTIEDARRTAYMGVEKISWPGMQVRSDIAAKPAQG
jgi:phosphoribosylamine--glycine ligase